MHSPSGPNIAFMSFPLPLQHDCSGSLKTQDRGIQCDPGHATLAQPSMVCLAQPVESGTAVPPTGQQQPHPARSSRGKGQHVNNPLGAIPFLRKYLQPFVLDLATLQFMVPSAWREGTVNLYAHSLRKWGLFCLILKVKPLPPSIIQLCQFLRALVEADLGFGAVNTAR